MGNILLKIQTPSSTGFLRPQDSQSIISTLQNKEKENEAFLKRQHRFESVPRGVRARLWRWLPWLARRVVVWSTETGEDRKGPGLWEKRSWTLFWIFWVQAAFKTSSRCWLGCWIPDLWRWRLAFASRGHIDCSLSPSGDFLERTRVRKEGSWALIFTCPMENQLMNKSLRRCSQRSRKKTRRMWSHRIQDHTILQLGRVGYCWPVLLGKMKAGETFGFSGLEARGLLRWRGLCGQGGNGGRKCR